MKKQLLIMSIALSSCITVPMAQSNNNAAMDEQEERTRYEWAAKSHKYIWLLFSIDFFDIDKVNEYALELAHACPKWPNTSKCYYGECNIEKLEQEGLLSKEARGWCGFCNAHGRDIHQEVLRDLDSDNPETIDKAFNFLHMRDDLCRAPKSYAKNYRANLSKKS